jgi:ELWxxDGT repeat protein
MSLFGTRVLFVALLFASQSECKDDGFDYSGEEEDVELTKAEIKVFTAFVLDAIGQKPRYLTRFKGQLWFNAESDGHGSELFKSDGKNRFSTGMFMDLNPGKEDSYPHTLTLFKGKMFFVAEDGKHGKELWQTDGTFDGTSMVVDINSNLKFANSAATDSSYAQGLAVYNDFLYFGADDGVHGFELWRSDGTASGTALFKDMNPGPEDSPIGQILVHTDGKLRFYVGEKLYESDGSADSVKLV